MRLRYASVVIPALIGVLLAVSAYFAPMENSGVDGTTGALLALIGASAVGLGALLGMMPAVQGWGLKLLNVLIGLGAVLTAVAAYFLMQYPFAIVMALALLGLLVAIAFNSRRRTA